MSDLSNFFREEYWKPLDSHVLERLDLEERARANRVAQRIEVHLKQYASLKRDDTEAQEYIKRQLDGELSTWREFERTVEASNDSALLDTLKEAGGAAANVVTSASRVGLKIALKVAADSLISMAQEKLEDL